MKKAAGYYFKIVLAWMVTIVFACYFLSRLGKQIGDDKEFAGVNSRSIGMSAEADDAEPQEGDSEEVIAEKRIKKAFNQIRNGNIDEVLELISEIGQDEYLKNNKGTIQAYFRDFSDWYKKYKSLERYYNMPKSEREKALKPAFSKGIQDFIKYGAVESYFGDKKSEYASVVPYMQIKLMNKLFKNHIGEDDKDGFIKEHLGAGMYKAYIDSFINGKESLSSEDGNVICGYIYASFVGLREDWKNSKAEEEALRALKTEIEYFQTHNTWKDDLQEDGKLSIQSKYLRVAKVRIEKRIEKGGIRRNYDKSKNLEPYTTW